MAKELPGYGTINVPKDREVPFGAVTPAPVYTQDLFHTSNWRIVRPVNNDEKCTRCLTCYMLVRIPAGRIMKRKTRCNGLRISARDARSASRSARPGRSPRRLNSTFRMVWFVWRNLSKGGTILWLKKK